MTANARPKSDVEQPKSTHLYPSVRLDVNRSYQGITVNWEARSVGMYSAPAEAHSSNAIAMNFSFRWASSDVDSQSLMPSNVAAPRKRISGASVSADAPMLDNLVVCLILLR